MHHTCMYVHACVCVCRRMWFQVCSSQSVSVVMAKKYGSVATHDAGHRRNVRSESQLQSSSAAASVFIWPSKSLSRYEPSIFALKYNDSTSHHHDVLSQQCVNCSLLCLRVVCMWSLATPIWRAEHVLQPSATLGPLICYAATICHKIYQRLLNGHKNVVSVCLIPGRRKKKALVILSTCDGCDDWIIATASWNLKTKTEKKTLVLSLTSIW